MRTAALGLVHWDGEGEGAGVNTGALGLSLELVEDIILVGDGKRWAFTVSVLSADMYTNSGPASQAGRRWEP